MLLPPSVETISAIGLIRFSFEEVRLATVHARSPDVENPWILSIDDELVP